MFEAQPELHLAVGTKRATVLTPKAMEATARRREIKETGGEPYEALLVRERNARALFRERHPEVAKADSVRRKSWKTHIVARARNRARKAGFEATIRVADLVWPTHCPVLGIRLVYPTRAGEGGVAYRPDRPTLDRWDNAKGYIPGNVFVISFRANKLKGNATADELRKIAAYARRGLP